MNDLRKAIDDQKILHADSVAMLKDIQAEIRNGTGTSGKLTTDFAILGGAHIDTETIGRIEAFYDRLQRHANQPMLVVLVRPRSRPEEKAELRMGIVPPLPSFDRETGHGWRLCDRFAHLDRNPAVLLVEEPMHYSPTSGALRPNQPYRVVDAILIGTQAIEEAARKPNPSFSLDDLADLMRALGLPPPTQTLPRTRTQLGV